MALLGFINRALGALMGTQLGIKLLPARDLRYALGIALLIAAVNCFSLDTRLIRQSIFNASDYK